MGTSIVATIVGVILLVLGYLIRIRKQMNLLAGYDSEKVTDPEGLANWVGGWCLLLGVVTLGVGWGVYADPEYTLGLVEESSTIILVACLVMVVGARRFRDRSTAK